MAAVRLPLLEKITPQGSRRFDSSSDVIPNVKLLGLYSQNDKGRYYLEDALRAAVPLYENCAVYDDHPMTPDGRILPRKPRTNKERVGSIRNVHFVEGKGLFGDLVVLRSHPTGRALIEAANDPNKHDFFALSHNTDGKTRTQSDGVLLVEKILQVRSCDVVQGGGTTRSLFEQKVNTMKIKELFEKLSIDPRLSTKKRRALLEQMDDDALDLGGEMEEPVMEEGGAVADPDQALKDGFRAAIIGCLDDDTKDMKAKLSRIKEILAAEEKLINGNDSAPETTPETDYESDEAKTTEQRRHKGQGVPLTEQDVSQLCETLHLTPKPEILKAIVGMPLATALPLLKELTERKMPKTRYSLPKSSTQTALTEQRKDPSSDRQGFLRRITNSRN